MSTSFRPAPAADHDGHEVRPFPYAEAAPGTAETQGSAYPSFLSGDRLMLEEIEHRERAARELGRREGEAETRAAVEAELLKIRQALAEMLTAFARERESFYHKVEPEIVNLALNIAHKILHREAQIDPLLLAGLVRVALEAIEFSTQVTVRVHPHWLVRWREYFNQHIDPGDMPEIVEDPTLDESRCIMQTHLGKTELGWEVQLKEIEQGLLDLLAQRPTASV